MPKWIPWDEAVEISGKSEQTLYKWEARGLKVSRQSIPGVGYVRLVDQQSLLDLMGRVTRGRKKQH